MSLITKVVKIKWNGRNKKHYESRGYVFTKISDEFEVKVQDLMDSANVLVKVKCDCEDCVNPITKPVRWVDYKRQVKEDGKCYCQKCALRLYSNENARLTKLENSKSLEQWCIDNNRQDVLDRWDYELNECSPNEISYSSNKKNYFKCPQGIHKSELKNINSFTSGHKGSIECKACNSFAQWGISNIGQDFLDLYWDYDRNNELGIDPWSIGLSSNKKTWIKCQNKDKPYHGSYEVVCSRFSIENARCPYCSSKKVHKYDSLGYLYPQVLETWSKKNRKSPYDYLPHSGKKVWWKCPEDKHKDYKRAIKDTNKCEFRCPNCVRERGESFLQEKVRLYLEKLGYEVLHEDKCTLNPKNIIQPPCGKGIKRKCSILRYDNEIVVNNIHIMIEVMGGQHYQISTWHNDNAKKYNTTPELELKYQQDKDKYKKKYVLSKGYEYLEIPYWTIDENNTYKILINNKINEILNRVIHKEAS